MLGALWLPDDGEDMVPGAFVPVPGTVVSPAFGCDGVLGVSTGGVAVDGSVIAPGLELGFVDGDDAFGLVVEPGTVDGVDVPGAAGVDWVDVPVDGAGPDVDGAL